jgi:hypothetical protein
MVHHSRATRPATLMTAALLACLTPWSAYAASLAPAAGEKPVEATLLAQKGPAPSIPSGSCNGPAPTSGLIYANLVELCPLVAEMGTARMERGSNGDDYIAASIDGINYAVDVYNCDPDCADLSFTASFEMEGVGIDLMNQWNQTRRFGKAYIREDGDAVIQIAINTRYGVPVETFRDDLVWWETVLEDYVSFIGFR